MEKTFYEILGVSPNATQEEIRQKYRSLAKKFHPDSGMENDVFIKMINEAYDTLKDTKKRCQYDSSLKEAAGNTYDYSSHDSHDTHTSYYDDHSTHTSYDSHDTYQTQFTFTGYDVNDNQKVFDLSNLRGFRKVLFLLFFYFFRMLRWCLFGIMVVVGVIARLCKNGIAYLFGFIGFGVIISFVEGYMQLPPLIVAVLYWVSYTCCWIRLRTYINGSYFCLIKYSKAFIMF